MKNRTPMTDFLVAPAVRTFPPVRVQARGIEEARRKARQFTERRNLRDISEPLMAAIAKAFAAANVTVVQDVVKEAA